MKVFILRKKGLEVVDLNRRRAVRERCLNCAAWEPGAVRDCTMTGCALHPFRMGQGKQDAKARSKAIRAFCLACCGEQPKEVRLCPCRDCPLFPYRRGTVDRSVEMAS